MMVSDHASKEFGMMVSDHQRHEYLQKASERKTKLSASQKRNDDGGLYTSSLAAKDHEEVKNSFQAAERGIGAHLCRVRPMSQLGKGQIDVEAVTDPVLIPIADWHRGEPAQVYPNEMGLCLSLIHISEPTRPY